MRYVLFVLGPIVGFFAGGILALLLFCLGRAIGIIPFRNKPKEMDDHFPRVIP